MPTKFWKLPEQYTIGIAAPAVVLDMLANAIALTSNPPVNTAVVKLEWDETYYNQCYKTYWQPSYAQNEVVHCENDAVWFVLGYGFVLAWSVQEEKGYFYIEPGLLDDLLTFSYPLLNLLIFLLKNRGYVPLHAAVIGNDNRFVLIPGKQNTGKSTTSATWALRGGQFVTDDLCFVNPEDPFNAHGFYPTIRLREPALKLIGHLLPADWLQQKNDSKYFFSLLTHLPLQFVAESRLNAIFCLDMHGGNPSHFISDAKTGYEYLASSVAFAFQHNAGAKLCLQAIKRLTRELPVLRVSLSPDADENFYYLKELIASL